MLTKKKRRRQSLQRGQAMVEYSLITHALLGIGVATGWFFFTVFMNAMDAYYEQLFNVLTAALP